MGSQIVQPKTAIITELVANLLRAEERGLSLSQLLHRHVFFNLNFVMENSFVLKLFTKAIKSKKAN